MDVVVGRKGDCIRSVDLVDCYRHRHWIRSVVGSAWLDPHYLGSVSEQVNETVVCDVIAVCKCTA